MALVIFFFRPFSLSREPQNSIADAEGSRPGTQIFFQGYVSLEKRLPRLGEIFLLQNYTYEGTRLPTNASSEQRCDGSRGWGCLFLLCTSSPVGTERERTASILGGPREITMCTFAGHSHEQ